VLTHSRAVREARREALAAIVADHRGDCLLCERSRRCKLQALCEELCFNSLRAGLAGPRLILVGGGLQARLRPLPGALAEISLAPPLAGPAPAPDAPPASAAWRSLLGQTPAPRPSQPRPPAPT
jgi:hypothetical protein